MSLKTLAVILARANSERLPGKNIKLLSGKPLIQYVIEAGLKCSKIDNVLVSTDSIDIQKIAIDLGAEAPFLRPDSLAKSETTSMEALRHAVATYEEIKGVSFSNIILLQPTSPLTTVEILEDAISKFELQNEQYMISVCKMNKKAQWFGQMKDNKFESFGLKVDADIAQYIPSGNFYIYKKENIINNTNNFAPYGYEVTSEMAIDIDTVIDFEYAQFMLSKQQN